MVADDIARCGVIDGRRYTLKVIKALVAFRILRALHVGEQRVEVTEQIACVDHTALSVARVDGLALKADGRLGGVKALPLQLADGAAVDRVGVLAAKRYRYPTARLRGRSPRQGRSKCRVRDGAEKGPERYARQAT